MKSPKFSQAPQTPSLGAVWFDYRRAKKLKTSTELMYDERLRSCFDDWMKLPIDSFNKVMVEARHQKITVERGAATANISLRILRALLNFAQVRYEAPNGDPIIKQNPVLILSRTGAWNRENARDRILPPELMNDWYIALRRIQSKTAQDFLLFILMTGCRSSEASNLLWSDVDFEKGEVTFRNTKNGKDHRLPVCHYVRHMLKRKYESKSTMLSHLTVFQSPGGSPYHLNCGILQRIVRTSKIKLSPHDLRRTYATIAHRIGIDPMNIKRLLNHSSTDVTWRCYIVYDPAAYRREVEIMGAGISMLLGINSPTMLD